MNGFSLVVACELGGGIGFAGSLPWPRIKADMNHFRKLTSTTFDPEKENALIMGSRTWLSLPGEALPRRRNIVLTRSGQPIEGIFPVQFASSLDQALALAEGCEETFVMGGGQVYQEALNHPLCKDIYLTRIKASYKCDTFFPLGQMEASFHLHAKKSFITEECLELEFDHWTRKDQSLEDGSRKDQSALEEPPNRPEIIPKTT